MKLARFITALLPALGVTLGLLLLMHFLILRDMKEPEEPDEFKLPEIVMPEREIQTEYDTRKPDKPQQPEEPPPDLPEPKLQPLEMNNAALNIGANVDTNMKMTGIGGFSSDGEYLPVVKVEARYPSRALSRGIEGYCVVEYTVTASGSTRDPKAVDCQPEGMFERVSVNAAEKFKYKPRVIDGEPVEVPGVRNKFTFQMAE